MKTTIKKFWRTIIPIKLRSIIYETRTFPHRTFINLPRRIRNKFLYRRARLYAKRTGILPSKTSSSAAYSLDAFKTLDSSPPATLSINYSLDTLKALDSMILNKLQLLQFGIPFQEAKFAVIELQCGGFGASILGILKGLTSSYLYHRTLLFDDSNLLYDFCYEPISIHSFKDISKKYTKKTVDFNFLPQKEKTVYFNLHGIFYSPFLSRLLNSVHPLSLPQPSLYFRGLLLGSFLKLKQEYKAHIEENRKELGFKNPIIGVHIRQGDVKTDPRSINRSIPFQIYLEVIKKVVEQTGIETVFITTDSEEVIQQLPKNSGIDFIYDDKEKRYDNDNARMIREHPQLKKQETMTAVKNIHLLAECDYIISSRSNWLYNSLSLSYFRNKNLNGILIEKQDNTDYYVEYLTTSNDNIPKEAHQPFTNS